MTCNDTQFKHLGTALRWYSTHNPARAKSVNLFETERANGFDDAVETWNFLCLKIDSTLGLFRELERAVFKLRHLSDSANLSFEDIAKKLHISEKTARKYSARIWDELERAFVVAEILPPTIH